MKISLQRYGIILGATLVVAVMEKFLLELLRAPYRPPHDMGSFLGGKDEFAAVIFGSFDFGCSVGRAGN